MNKLTGFIKDIKSYDDILEISIDVKGKIFTSLIISSNEIYKLGEKINILFKETEVMIATVFSKVSARNASICKINDIKNGEILSSISFDFYGNKIVSIITKNALLDLNCKENEEFMWFVKSNEITIQKV